MHRKSLGFITFGIVLSLVMGEAAAQITGGPYDPRARVIQTSYVEAFCRNPNLAETNFWLRSPQSGDFNWMVANHRIFLKSSGGAQELQDTLRLSYLATFRRGPSQGEVNYWTPAIQQNGYTCAELKSFHNQYRSKNPGAR